MAVRQAGRDTAAPWSAVHQEVDAAASMTFCARLECRCCTSSSTQASFRLPDSNGKSTSLSTAAAAVALSSEKRKVHSCKSVKSREGRVSIIRPLNAMTARNSSRSSSSPPARSLAPTRKLQQRHQIPSIFARYNDNNNTPTSQPVSAIESMPLLRNNGQD